MFPSIFFALMIKVKLFKYNFLFHIELICSYCYFLKSHNSHKILLIDDEESLNKENITFDESTKEFDTKFEKINNLKEKIEQEIININKSYDTTFNDITKSFEEKHAKLYKEENDLIEKLQNEVTKIKEKLENFLSESSSLIRTCEKIKKGITKLEKNEKPNNIQNISYISKIYKIKKDINALSYESMENMKMNFNEDKSTVNYEKYYFNNIPIPYNITINDITNSSFKISWEIDKDFEISDKINFKIEIRKENENFNQVYKGNKNNFCLDELSSNTNYEIRICSCYDKYESPWGEIAKIKTKEILGENNIFGSLFGNIKTGGPFDNNNNNNTGGLFGNNINKTPNLFALK